MAASVEVGDSLEELEELFLQDTTDDFFDFDEEKNWQDFRTGPYFIMHTLLCFKKTIAITIEVIWDCGALFFLFRGFFSKSIWT